MPSLLVVRLWARRDLSLHLGGAVLFRHVHVLHPGVTPQLPQHSEADGAEVVRMTPDGVP